jgi:hypothetical protein
MKFLHSRQGNGTYVLVSKEDALIQTLAAAPGRIVERGINPGDLGRHIHILDRSLTDSFASYLPSGWTLYIGSMVEPVRRASLTPATGSLREGLERTLTVLGPGLSPSLRTAGFMPYRGRIKRATGTPEGHRPVAAAVATGDRAKARQYTLSPVREGRMDHLIPNREGALNFQSDTVTDLQETRNLTSSSFPVA